MSNSLSFCDSALTDIVQKSSLQLQSFRKTLEDTSTDIKMLEEWLIQCAVCFPTYVSVSEYSHIGWDKFGSTWRLVHESANDDPPETRPLIDTPIKTRFAARAFLPVLVKEIASAIPNVVAETAVQSRYKPDDLDEIFANEDEIPF